jgi:DNA-binding beta-propeller fold protein YncE
MRRIDMRFGDRRRVSSGHQSRFSTLDRLAFLAALITAGLSAAHAASFVTYETGQVRPLAMSPDGSRLFAVNTPDGRLEVFDVKSAGLTLAASVPVGMEPVAVEARTNSEVWVVNHLSDSVSIVDLSATPSRVTRTLLVGDERYRVRGAGSEPRLHHRRAPGSERTL